jgi:hypothetical protein
MGGKFFTTHHETVKYTYGVFDLPLFIGKFIFKYGVVQNLHGYLFSDKYGVLGSKFYTT